MPDSDESTDCKMTFFGDTLVTITDTSISGPLCATNIKLKKSRTLYIKVKGKEENGVFNLKGNISINALLKFELAKQREARLKQMGKLVGPVVASKCYSLLSCSFFMRKKRETSHFKYQLDVGTIGLNQTSVNYSKKTPSGNSSVYFIVPHWVVWLIRTLEKCEKVYGMDPQAHLKLLFGRLIRMVMSNK
ncbi:hypothetical protein BSPWISOXPB_1611 [uncultured Gammaproteobacteria bacterium]|nr:hypothetical protein BSPWISOXPB_1611 [uncultured Gammaproteobacteria bacterium]